MSGEDARRRPESYTGLRIAASLMVALGAVGVVGGLRVREAGGFSVVGPRQFPIVIGCCLIVLGLLFLGTTTVRLDRELGRLAAAEDRATDWRTVLVGIALLFTYAFALVGFGFVAATAPFFVAQARVLGSRRLRRDLVVGTLLSAALYVGFTRWLGVELPTGPVEQLLGG